MALRRFILDSLGLLRHKLHPDGDVAKYFTPVGSVIASSLRSLAVSLQDYLWMLAKDVVSVGLTALYIAAILVFISFLKSLQPKYCFEQLPETDEKKSVEDRPSLRLLNSIRLSKNEPERNLDQQEGANEASIKRLVDWFKDKYDEVHGEKSSTLSSSEIQSAYQQLPWSQTQFDLESVNWLNETLHAFWPSARATLNKYVFRDLLKPRQKGSLTRSLEKVTLSKLHPKLSFYLSCRRKVEWLRKVEARNLARSPGMFNRGVFTMIRVLLKLALIYVKQFISDYVGQMIKRPDPDQMEEELEERQTKVGKLLGLDELEDYPDNLMKSLDEYESIAAKKDKFVKNKRCKPNKSAPAVLTSRRVVVNANSLLGPNNLESHLRRRRELCEFLRRAHRKLNRKPLTFERIKLGDSNPAINGIKFVENIHGLKVERVSNRIVPSDHENMRFMVELSYKSDDAFNIRLSNLPILSRVSLIKLSVQLRLFISINHTTAELNRDLKILETPGDVLFPVINHVQLALVDVPKLDWQLERPATTKSSLIKCISPGQRTGRFVELVSSVRATLDPVNLINHSYFKFVLSSMARLIIYWFRPFDIRLGSHLYLKSIC